MNPSFWMSFKKFSWHKCLNLFKIWLEELNIWFKEVDLFQSWLKELNFSNKKSWQNWTLSWIRPTVLNFQKNMNLTELKFFSMTHRFFFQYDSQNWTFFFTIRLTELNLFSLNTTHRIEAFNPWIWRKEMKPFSWIWRKEIEPFLAKMTQRIEPFNFWIWLTELKFFYDAENSNRLKKTKDC